MQMADKQTMHDAFLDELRDMYHAEKQLTQALPKLVKKARSADLAQAFKSHLAETENHVTRLEQVFEELGETAKTRTCEGMKGIIDEANSMLKEDFDEQTMDAVLIASAQRAEHYEISAYGTLVTWARTMDHDTAADLLQQNLDEEKAADETLTDIAESGVNEQAAELAN